MKRKDWLCPKRNHQMVKVSDKYMTCLCGQTRLFSAWGIFDLPEVVQVDYKRFLIAGAPWYYERLTFTSKGCLDECPRPNVVVALSPSDRPFAFFPTKPPRKKVRK